MAIEFMLIACGVTATSSNKFLQPAQVATSEVEEIKSFVELNPWFAPVHRL